MPSAVNVCGDSATSWVVGLVAGNGRYLTQEKFGFKLNASGTTLRNKQIWTMEQKGDAMLLRSHLGRYVSADRRGNVSCDEEEAGSDAHFRLEYAADGSGRWCFRSAHDTYLRAGEEALSADARVPGDLELFRPHLAMHPQVNLRHTTRKKYAHLSKDALRCEDLVPWGADSLVTLAFNGFNYLIKSSDGRLLSVDGSLQDSETAECQFSLEIRFGAQSQGLAFHNQSSGLYLTSSGADGQLKGVRKTMTRDELFEIESAAPQVCVVAPNGKKASIRQGVDVSANQSDEAEETEVFQMEYDKSTKTYSFLTCNDKFWKLTASGVQASASHRGVDTQIGVEWLPDGAVQLRAPGGEGYLGAKPTGQLQAGADPGHFHLVLLNRPQLILRSEFGFIGFKTPSSTRLECNRSVWDVLCLEPEESQPGTYRLSSRGKYVQLSDGGLSADGSSPALWVVELHQRTRLALKLPGQGYLKGSQNGQLSLSEDPSAHCLWEY